MANGLFAAGGQSLPWLAGERWRKNENLTAVESAVQLSQRWSRDQNLSSPRLVTMVSALIISVLMAAPFLYLAHP